jgi:hypothetical protein
MSRSKRTVAASIALASFGVLFAALVSYDDLRDTWVGLPFFIVRHFAIPIGVVAVWSALAVIIPHPVRSLGELIRRRIDSARGPSRLLGGSFRLISIPLAMVAILFATIMVFVLLARAVQIATAQVYYVRNLLVLDYRVDLFETAVAAERAGKTERASQLYEHALRADPEDPINEKFEFRIRTIRGEIDLSRSHLERAVELEAQRGLCRQSFFLVCEAARLNPGNELVATEVRSRLEVLGQCADVPAQFVEAVKSEDSDIERELYSKYAWYLFEDELVDDRLGSRANPRAPNLARIRALLDKYESSAFRAAVEKSWSLGAARSLVAPRTDDGL